MIALLSEYIKGERCFFMKRIIAALLGVMLMLSMSACVIEEDVPESTSTLPYAEAIDNYLDFYYHCDTTLLEEIAPMSIWKDAQFGNGTGNTDKESIKGYMTDNKTVITDELVGFIPKKISWTAQETGDLTSEEIAQIKETYNGTVFVVNGSKFALTATFTREEKTEEVTTDLVAVKIDGQYYITDAFRVLYDYAAAAAPTDEGV